MNYFFLYFYLTLRNLFYFSFICSPPLYLKGWSNCCVLLAPCVNTGSTLYLFYSTFNNFVLINKVVLLSLSYKQTNKTIMSNRRLSDSRQNSRLSYVYVRLAWNNIIKWKLHLIHIMSSNSDYSLERLVHIFNIFSLWNIIQSIHSVFVLLVYIAISTRRGVKLI